MVGVTAEDIRRGSSRVQCLGGAAVIVVFGLVAAGIVGDGGPGVGVVDRRCAGEGSFGGVERGAVAGAHAADDIGGAGVDDGAAGHRQRGGVARIDVERAGVEVEDGVPVIGDIDDIPF